MILLERPPYTPFMDPRLSRPPGLLPLDSGEWFVIHKDFTEQMAYRQKLLSQRRETVLARLPEGDAVASELLEAVLESVAGLPGYSFGDGFVTRPDGGDVAIDPSNPLETAGRLVADDLCTLLPDPISGEYRLVGAVLCFPSRWLLAEKMGRPLTAIHDPVPDYDGTLARRVNRVFEALRAGRPLWRVNWIVHGTAELHLPLAVDEDYILPEDHGQGFFLRTERQTLTRLPRSGGIVFGIKTSVSRVESLTGEEAASLHAAMAGYDDATIGYKSGAEDHGAALARLAEIACQERTESAS